MVIPLCVSGSPIQVAAALEQMKKKFPTKHNPDITYIQTNVPVDLQTVLSPEIMQVNRSHKNPLSANNVSSNVSKKKTCHCLKTDKP